ncbi:MAG TPA: response regulator [Pyrinomonadaceae bacterium]|nr:response regulator [Pyrinomonadaceae bacterium]
MAKKLEKAGEYEAACEAMYEFWPERHEPPRLEVLDDSTKAEVLLRAGSLAGWIGSSEQSEGSQEAAKNLLTLSLEMFEKLGQPEGAAGAHSDLALCYWREGAFDEARIHFAKALGILRDTDCDLKASVLIRSGMIEVWARQLNEALRYYNEAAAILEKSTDDALKGSLHNQLALLYRKLGTPELNDEYTDRALIEYAAASFHFDKAGNERYLARVENNLGFLFFTIGRYKEAHQHLDRARHLFLELKDLGTAAQVDDTRARTLLAEGRTVEAERFARQAVKTLEKGGEQALLAEALTTHGTALARLGNYSRSKALLERAIEVAETAGDLEGSGRAKLSFIEELGEQTSARELASIYESAVSLLEQSQDPSAKKRLVSCARAVIDALTKAEDDPDSAVKEHSWEGFSFRQEVVKIERALIERALRDTGGSVTKASRLLGFKHHQSLIALINTRHKNLLNTRSAIRKRRHHIFSRPRRIPRKVVKPNAERANSQISILHVEDNKLIAKLVDDMCAPEDWRVELSVDGDSALRKLTGNDHYDLLVVDNDLPGLSGLELVQRARKMTHHRRTPIVMLSGSDCETEAWGAGVDAFLKKPEQIKELTSTIARLLVNGHEHA